MTSDRICNAVLLGAQAFCASVLEYVAREIAEFEREVSRCERSLACETLAHDTAKEHLREALALAQKARALQSRLSSWPLPR